MPKFAIGWDTGFGGSAEEIDAPDLDAAKRAAYESWNAEIQDRSDYDAKPWPEGAVRAEYSNGEIYFLNADEEIMDDNED